MNMMTQQTTPTKPLQICQPKTPIEGAYPNEAYIITEDPNQFGDDEEIKVVSITELQRKQHNPDAAIRIQVKKKDLIVVAEDLESYIRSFNS